MIHSLKKTLDSASPNPKSKRMAEMGSKGGLSTVARYGRAFMSRLGKLGMKKRWGGKESKK
jgi:hypothetical protein